MSIKSFDNLTTILGPRISYQNATFRLAIQPQERLAVTLRYLASGYSFVSLHYEYLIGETTIREIVRDTCDALWERMLSVYMPEIDLNGWLDIADDFYRITNFPNCIGAVDGKQIRIRKPHSSGSEFSTVLLAIADSHYRFIYVEVGEFVSSSDSNVFKKHSFSKLLETSKLNVPEPRSAK